MYVRAALSDPHSFRCQAPVIPSFEPMRDGQSIKLRGQMPTSEVQVVEISALPAQSEIQRIASQDWGVQNPILRLDVAATSPSVDDRAIYRLQTQLDNQAELQLLQLTPSAFGIMCV